MRQLLWRAWLLWRANPVLFYRRLATLARSPLRNGAALLESPRRYRRIQRSYDLWLQSEPRARGAQIVDGPLISVLMPVFNTADALLDGAIRSVLGQTYTRWELCIADDASTEPHVRALLDRYSRTDERVRVVFRHEPGHIAEASNSALALATGEFVVLLDHDDVLAPHALQEVARAIGQDRAVDFVYSDEDKLDFDGRRVEPFFKPAWSPSLLLSCNYITHLAALRRSLVVEVGGFRPATAGSQDHDLFLRVTERARAVAHVPLILYSWRKSATSTAATSAAKPYTVEASRRALHDSLARRDLDARLEPAPLSGLFYVRRRVPAPTRLSLVVVGRGDDWRALVDCEGVDIVDIAYVEDAEIRSTSVVPLIDDLSGDYLLWIDARSSPDGPDSVTALVEPLQNERVAVSGGMTVRSRDDAVLQAGLIIGDGGQPEYAHAGLRPVPQPVFYLNLKDLPREVSAVHVGCCAVRPATWRDLAGWRSALPPSLAMTDLCLRALDRGQGVVYTPLARFRSERVLPVLPRVHQYDWTWQTFSDPFWNPNLTPTTNDGLPFRYTGDRPARIRQSDRRLSHHAAE